MINGISVFIFIFLSVKLSRFECHKMAAANDHSDALCRIGLLRRYYLMQNLPSGAELAKPLKPT